MAARRQLLPIVCGLAAAVALFAIMCLTLADVSGRKLLGHSLPGSLELTELLMVAVIFFGLPLASLRGDHVVFDSLDGRLPPRLRRWQQGLMNSLCALMCAGLAYVMANKAEQIASYGDTTAQLKLPIYPMVYLMAAMLLLAALMHAWRVLKPQDSHSSDAADESTAL